MAKVNNKKSSDTINLNYFLNSDAITNRRKSEFVAKMWKSGKVALSPEAMKRTGFKVGDYVRIVVKNNQLLITDKKNLTNEQNSQVRKISAKGSDTTVSVGKSVTDKFSITATTECTNCDKNGILFVKSK